MIIFKKYIRPCKQYIWGFSQKTFELLNESKLCRNSFIYKKIKNLFHYQYYWQKPESILYSQLAGVLLTTTRGLVIQLTQQRYTTPHPMLLLLVRGNQHSYDKVGRVSSCAQNTSALTCLVNGTFVGVGFLDVSFLAWLQPHLKKLTGETGSKYRTF